MDTVQQFLQQEHIVVPQNFVVAGISKVSFSESVFWKYLLLSFSVGGSVSKLIFVL
jgi:hypothetical protein